MDEEWRLELELAELQSQLGQETLTPVDVRFVLLDSLFYFFDLVSFLLHFESRQVAQHLFLQFELLFQRLEVGSVGHLLDLEVFAA